jgi:class 3 adenylate cyclase
VATATDTLGLASYVPRYQLARLRRAVANDGRLGPRDEASEAALLFFDVSGFTRLTEDFARRGRAGAEALSDALNRFFGQLGDLVARHGGDIVQIAGDAAVVLWPIDEPDEDGRALPAAEAIHRAAACGLALQQQLGDFTPLPDVHLRMRAGVSLGRLRYLELGGVGGRWESLVLGDALSDVIAATAMAVPGQLIASPAAALRLSPHAQLDPRDGGRARVESVTPIAELAPSSTPRVDGALARLLESQLPRLLVERAHEGQLDWLAEFRTATVLFVNLPGFDPATATIELLDEATRALQQTIAERDGAIYQFLADDKGTTFVAAFGIPPHAHADDAARAVHAAIGIRRALEALGLGVAIGVTTGRVFSGVFGTDARRHYTMRGSVVNLAARLMVRDAGDILCDATTARASARQLEFEALPAVSVKGRDEPVAVLRPRGPATSDTAFRTPLVGRGAERERILTRLEAALAGGTGNVVLVSGEPGIGKSHLLADAITQAEAHGLATLVASADAVERSTAYYVFRAILAGLLGAGSAPAIDVLREATADDPALASWLPVLNAVLPLGLPDTEVTRQMDATSRADATEALIVHLVERRAAARPLLIAMDDVHWLDSASLALTRAIGRRCARVVLLLGARPLDAGAPDDLRTLLQGAAERIDLASLADHDVLAVVCGRLGVDALPPAVERFILARAEGHPFHAEELGLALRDAGSIVCEGRSCRLASPDVDLTALEIPHSLEGVITGRIDRLTPRQQLTLKTASVIGRVFGVDVLRDVYPVLEDQPEVPGVLENLERLDVTRLFSTDPELAYLFKHVTTHEVAYNLLLLSQRRLLHRQIAAWYERTHAADLDPYAPLLAHHWERAEDAPRALEWLERAAAQALRTFANREAVGFLRRALDLAERTGTELETARRAEWERMLGEAHLKLADTTAARKHLGEALRLLGQPLPASKASLSLDLARQLGRQIGIRFVPSLFLRTSDRERDRFVSSAHHYLAEVAFFGHDLPGLLHATFASLNHGERSAATRETVNGLGTLAHVASMAGLRGVARRYRARSLALAEREGSLPTIAFAHQIAATFGNCVGDWRDVHASCRRAIALFEELGDRFRWETCNCIYGYTHFAIGDQASARAVWRAAYESAGPEGAPQILVWSRAGELLIAAMRGAAGADVGPLVAEVEALCARDLAAAEQVLAWGALAAAHRYRGEPARAREAAEQVSRLIEKEPPSTSYTLWSVAAAGLVWLSLSPGAGSYEHERAKKIAKALDTFAFTMPVGAACASLFSANVARAEGKKRVALDKARKAIAQADALALPWEGARAHRLVGEILPPGNERALAIREAKARFERLGAAHEVALLERLGRG